MSGDLHELEAAIAQWMSDYNHHRIHQNLGYTTPWEKYRPGTRLPRRPERQKRMSGKLPTGSKPSDELCGLFSQRIPVDNFPQWMEQTPNNTITQRPFRHILNPRAAGSAKDTILAD